MKNFTGVYSMASLVVAIVLGLFSVTTVCAADAPENLFASDSGAKETAGERFLKTASFGQEVDGSIGGQMVNVVRLQNFKNELGGNGSGNNYISFSYEGSTGLLGFSSGYIYPSEDDKGFSVAAGPDRRRGYWSPDRAKNVYLGLDVAHSIALAEDMVLGLKAGVIYLEDIYNEEDAGTVSLLFVMPLEINDSVKIVPRMHWSRSLSPYLEDQPAKVEPDAQNADTGSFYGGVSISFAY